jgi:prolyl 4-hydroxylase
MAPKLSTIVGYLLALIPAYIFVYSPISRLIFGSLQEEANEPIDISKIDPELLSLISPDDPLLNCSSQPYDIHILSRAPLVIYIESFLSDSEASHMVEVRCVSPGRNWGIIYDSLVHLCLN